jgi:membrane fusion protein (multidrug efflux system)
MMSALAAQTPSPSGVLRLTGLVEAERAVTIVAPRLHGGRGGGEMVLTRVVPGGSKVAAGQPIVEIDPQDMLREAFNRRVEVNDIEGQIARMRANQSITRSADDTAITAAQNDVARARLEATKNELIPKVDAEKNTLALEEAEAKLKQLKETYDLKRKVAEADVRIQEIRRDRARLALEQAERNAELMTITAPFDGLAVLKMMFRGSQQTELQEGDIIRPGMGLLDVIDPNKMRVRARINQADITRVAAGDTCKIRLDAYPGLEFDGVIETIAPLATPGGRNRRVRSFVTVVAIHGSHPNLLPDLTASVDVFTGGRR